MKRLSIGIGVAVLVAAGVGGALFVKSRRVKPIEVEVVQSARQRIVQEVSGTGKIKPRTEVKISADVSAKIVRLPVVEGQWVEKGALLVELDRERFVAAVESAEANVGAAEGNAAAIRESMSRAAKDFTRSQELSAKGIEASAAHDAAQAAHEGEKARYDAALKQVDEARAALKQARDDLSKTTIHAPMAGTISDLKKEEGEMALGSQFTADTILVLANLDAMEAQVKVDESDIVSVAIGQPAEIEVDALPDQKLSGVVYEIANSAASVGEGTAEQRTEFEVKITIDSPPDTLRPGMTATAEITTKTNDQALGVPLQCVAVRTVDQLMMKGETRKAAEAKYTADEDGFVEIVFVVQDGKATARKVETGIQSNELIEILSGLEEGEQVVSGSYRAISKDLENGGEVEVVDKIRPPKGDKPGAAPD